MKTSMTNCRIRRLSIEDLSLIKELLSYQAYNQQYIVSVAHRLQNDTQLTTLHLYGLFLDSTLIAIGGGFLGLKMPFWTLAYFHRHKDLNSLFMVNKILDNLIEYAENQGIYRFDYVHNHQSLPSALMKLSQKASRYQHYEDALIKRQNPPQFDCHWLHLIQQVQDTDTIIQSAVLKPEFRKDIINKITKSESYKSHAINQSRSSGVNR